MRDINKALLESVVKEANIRPRLRQQLRFSPENPIDWGGTELLAVHDRSGRKGVLLMELGSKLYVTEYELTARIFDRQSGRTRPIICDLCCTWQSGSGVGRITFPRKTDQHTITFLCCADLRCSEHVRDKTQRSRLSRAQLREDLTTKQRASRLNIRLKNLVHILELEEVDK